MNSKPLHPASVLPNSDTNDSTSEPKYKNVPPPARCLYCGFTGQLVWVHGHGQCSNCGVNTDECCRGEQ